MPSLVIGNDLVKTIQTLRDLGVSRFRVSETELEVWLESESSPPLDLTRVSVEETPTDPEEALLWSTPYRK